MITNSEISRYMTLNKKQKAGTINVSEKNEFLLLKEKYVLALQNNPKDSVDDKDVARINELAKKLKTEGLTDEEDEEYVVLRLAYVLSYKRNVAGQVNNIDIVGKDGSVENLGEKYGKQ